MRWRTQRIPQIVFCAFAVCAISCAVANADEIRLKDGSKIIGTIVGFEDGSFKVQTAYGFAMVRKASILEIVPDDSAKSTDTAGEKEDQKPADPSAPKPPAKPVAAPQTTASAKPTAKPAAHPANSAAPQKEAPAAETLAASSDASGSPSAPGTSPASSVSPAAAHSSLAPVAPVRAASASANTPAKPSSKPVAGASLAASTSANGIAAPSTVAPATAKPVATPASAATPAPEAHPLPLKESVLGNLYSNQTYGFSMYRPPEWEILGDPRSAMPEAITALGTDDHSTLLVIGRDVQGGSIDARAAGTEHKLRDIYDNYRPALSRHISIAGLPAVELRFRGTADEHDWSVTAVTVARGNEVFTILGMTYADSDLIQFQEAVLSKVIGSLQFVPAQ
jgi:hypothetical protein